MANTGDESPFTGFGIGSFTQARDEGGVFLLAVWRDGALSASAHATERGAMLAGAGLLDDERDDEDDEGGTLEDRFARAQQIVGDEGGAMEIVSSPVHGA